MSIFLSVKKLKYLLLANLSFVLFACDQQMSQQDQSSISQIVQPNELAKSISSQEVALVITHGQSLSIGVAGTSPLISAIPEYPNHVLALKTTRAEYSSLGWQDKAVVPSQISGLTPLIQTMNESPTSGILNAIVGNYIQDGLTPPKLLSISGGHGGRTLVELMIRRQDIHPTITAGLSNTVEGDPFVVDSNGVYTYYIKKNNQAVTVPSGSPSGSNIRPVYYNNILEQVIRGRFPQKSRKVAA